MQIFNAFGSRHASVGVGAFKQPSILHLSVQNSLKPRVNYFRHELGIASEDLVKVITRNPAVLTFSVEDQIAPRVEFLKNLGISHENVAKLILRHPQTLQYSFDGIKEHVDFLAKDCNMNDEEVAKTISRLNTFFSLSLEDNLRPKYEYLIDELWRHETNGDFISGLLVLGARYAYQTKTSVHGRIQCRTRPFSYEAFSRKG